MGVGSATCGGEQGGRKRAAREKQNLCKVGFTFFEVFLDTLTLLLTQLFARSCMCGDTLLVKLGVFVIRRLEHLLGRDTERDPLVEFLPGLFKFILNLLLGRL